MNIAAYYSFNDGYNFITKNFDKELDEIKQVISRVDALLCKTKSSEEKTMAGRVLFSPPCLNKQFKNIFNGLGWENHKELCDYKYGTFLESYKPSDQARGPQPFRDMDFIKPNIKLGVEVQFGKYAFMVYNVCAKMTIFHNLCLIDAGIEIVPTKHLADEMSTGVSYFEQIAWDLEKRGVSNIDIPVLILGIDV